MNYEVLKNGVVIGKRGKPLKPYTNRYGYKMVGFYDKNKKKTKQYSVHQLVAINFIPNPENKKYVNHIDGNKSNNDISNLEWVNASENVKHYYSSLNGVNGRTRKISIDGVMFNSVKYAAKYLGVHKTTIYN